MTHASVPDEQRLLLGIDDSLIRLSVGIESCKDLIADLDCALNAALESVRKSHFLPKSFTDGGNDEGVSLDW